MVQAFLGEFDIVLAQPPLAVLGRSPADQLYLIRAERFELEDLRAGGQGRGLRAMGPASGRGSWSCSVCGDPATRQVPGTGEEILDAMAAAGRRAMELLDD